MLSLCSLLGSTGSAAAPVRCPLFCPKFKSLFKHHSRGLFGFAACASAYLAKPRPSLCIQLPACAPSSPAPPPKQPSTAADMRHPLQCGLQAPPAAAQRGSSAHQVLQQRVAHHLHLHRLVRLDELRPDAGAGVQLPSFELRMPSPKGVTGQRRCVGRRRPRGGWAATSAGCQGQMPNAAACAPPRGPLPAQIAALPQRAVGGWR